MSWIELVAQRPPREVPEGAQRPQKTNPGYRFENNLAGDETDVYVYDGIGGWLGVSADDFIRDLQAVNSSRINLRLNSPGGAVFEGIAIANALRSHSAKVTVYVDGLAASIASVIALAGDRLVMMPQSQLMIHDASGGCFGNAADMEYMVDLLNKQSDNIADAYADKAGGTAAEWRDLMKAETWYSAKEAVAAGLADEVQSAPVETEARATQINELMARTWDLTAFKYAGREKAPQPTVKATLTSGEHVLTASAVKSLQDQITSLTTLMASMQEAIAPLTSATPPWLKPDEEEEEEDEPEDAVDPDEEPEASAEEPEAAVEEEPEDAADPEDEPVDEAPPVEDNAPEIPSAPEIDDAWSQIVAQFHQPSPSADDVFNSLKEAW